MAQRASGYERRHGENYATPPWPIEWLLAAEPLPDPIWECARGDGYMVETLRSLGRRVVGRDTDFLACRRMEGKCIVTNPPFNLADEFVRHALALSREVDGKVCMLLPMGFDSAKSRRDIFEDCPAHKAQLVLTRRIRWANIKQKKNGPSMNHCWQVWDHRYVGPSLKRWLYDS